MSAWEKGLLVVMSATQKLHEAGLTKKQVCGSLPLKKAVGNAWIYLENVDYVCLS